MGNCKDCKYWESHFDTRSKTWNTCEYPDWVNYDAKIPEDSISFYADAHDDCGLDAGIKTGSLFGCIKFIQKVG